MTATDKGDGFVLSNAKVPRWLCLTFAFGLLGGCAAVGPDYAKPELDTPDQWQEDIRNSTITEDSSFRTWWSLLDDPLLNSMMARAVADSLDLKIAYARIAEARARMGVATGLRFPDVNANGAIVRDRISEGVFEEVPPPRDRIDDFAELGVDANWEIDLWGRVRRSIESAGADYQASVENYRDVLVVLYADIASNYVQARTAQERIRLAHHNLNNQRDTLKLVIARHRSGLAPELDIRQAELNVASTESTIPLLQTELVAAINRLNVLLGVNPGTLNGDLTDAGQIPQPPQRIKLALPAEVVRQRPDLRRAEQQLAAQTARIGVATAELYPKFSLFGNFNFMTAAGDLLDNDNAAWSIGSFFTWNLFDGGRVRNVIKVEEARTEQALHLYEKTLLVALEDVENAMTDFAKSRIRQVSLEQAVKAAEKSVMLVKVLYKTGLTDFQNVLDMERTLFARQDELARGVGDVAQGMISLYKAMGGGWDIEDIDANPDKEHVDWQDGVLATRGEAYLTE